MPFAWLLIAAIFGLLEVATVAFFAAFLAVGALGAALAAAFGADIIVQLVVFLVVSFAGLVGIRPFAIRRLRRHTAARLPSGAESMIGQQAVVVDPIQDSVHPGHVFISGENWLAVTGNGMSIEAGRTVVIIEIRQTTLVVAPV